MNQSTIQLNAPRQSAERHQRVLWSLWIAVMLLAAIGLASIFSATTGNIALTRGQLVYFIIGMVLAMVINFVDYRDFSRWAYPIYGFSLLLLILVLIPGIGVKVNGARRWLDFGIVQFQPSELAKLTMILLLSFFLSRPNLDLRSGRTFFTCLGIIGLTFVIILKEPDLGSSIVLFPVGMAIMFIAGIPTRFLLKFIGAVALLIILLVVEVLYMPSKFQFIKLEEYQKRRLKVFFHVDYAPRNASPEEKRRLEREQFNDSYNVNQAMISVGSGGLFGQGWRRGTQIELGYLPNAVAHNDFIFSVIAEEQGFLGSMVILTLYGTLLFSGIRVAGQARDRLGKLLAIGITTLWFSQIFINIGMNVGLTPVTGLPLPLLSHGGSAGISVWIAAGVLQNIYAYRRNY